MRCQFCQIRNASEVHHLFNGSARNISDYYNLKINLCKKCHNESHGKIESQKEYRADYKEYYRNEFLKILGINNLETLNQVMNKSRKYWTTIEHIYMRNIKNKLFEKSVKNINV